MKIIWKWWKHKNDLIAKDTETADRLKAVVDEITLNGEELWMRSSKAPEPEPDLKTCVIRCVDDDNARAEG